MLHHVLFEIPIHFTGINIYIYIRNGWMDGLGRWVSLIKVGRFGMVMGINLRLIERKKERDREREKDEIGSQVIIRLSTSD